MGVYNTLIVNQSCDNCKNIIDRKIQFQFGDVWLHEYRLGDKLQWGGNDYGRPGLKLVKVLGTAEECPRCGYNPDYDVFIENDIIREVRSIKNADEYLLQKEDYIVLQN